MSGHFGLVMLALTAAPTLAQNPPHPTPAALEAGLGGQWKGTLTYRDYRSNKMVELPVQTEYRGLDDSATVLNISTFDDGPASGNVIITTALLFNVKAGTAENVAIRKGKPIDRETDKVSLIAYTDPLHWTLQYDHEGLDGGQRSKVRSIETRDGDTLSIEEDVVPLFAKKKDWQMRNITHLTRVAVKGP